MLFPGNFSTVDYSQIIQFALYSPGDDITVVGNYKGRGRNLALFKGCNGKLAKCDALAKSFNWTVVSHDENNLKV